MKKYTLKCGVTGKELPVSSLSFRRDGTDAGLHFMRLAAKERLGEHEYDSLRILLDGKVIETVSRDSDNHVVSVRN